jgi:uncharacterized alkaline shock family protein YloU
MSDVFTIDGAGGTISLAPGVLPSIVQRAAETVEGVRVRRRRRGLEVRVEGDTVRVELALAAAYGAVLPDIGRAVQERVAEALGRMCGLEVAAVDVTVEELVGA